MSINNVEDPRSKEGRVALSKMVTKLFNLWKLNVEDQLSMLGFSESSRMTLNRYKNGEPLADSQDLLDRVKSLLNIHRSLRVLFPENRELVYSWISLPNKDFDGKTPVEVIRAEGFLGLLMVEQYLDFVRGR